MRRLMFVFGTRPEAIKLAPFILALRDAPDFHTEVAVTAQHREMLDQVTALFGIDPDFDLAIMQDRQSLAGVTVRAVEGLDRLLDGSRPDAMVVQGDTTSTFAGALCAHYHRVPVVHVEAGLRTYQRYSPFPEELNRRLTTQLSSLHLAPTSVSRANLLREGIPDDRVIVTGNSVIDALLWAVDQRRPYGDPRLARLDEDDGPVLLVTAHRRESWGPPMAGIGRALRRLATEPGLRIVLPLHRNPRVREELLPSVADVPTVILTEPLPYGDFARLMARSTVVLTDSGGVQEEAPSLGKPVLVMRELTERPEGVAAGTARVIGTQEDVIVAEVLRLLRDPEAYAKMANAVNPYGDGRASQRSVAALSYFFGEGPRPKDFDPAALSP